MIVRVPRPLVRVEHALPTRVRLRVARIVGARVASERIARRIADEMRLERVTVRVRTGSILLEDRARKLDPAHLAARVDDLLRSERDDDGIPLSQSPPFSRGPTRLAHAVAHAATEINDDVGEMLGHRADLGTLLPIAFATGGLVEVIASRKVPGPTWFNIFWWSLRSFMTFNVDAVNDEADDVSSDASSGDEDA